MPRFENKLNLLITGGAGFIGSHFTELITKEEMYNITVIDSLTYAGNLRNLQNINHLISFKRIDIRNSLEIEKLFIDGKFDIVINFAAESHVDNSISNPYIFLETNILGTQVLVDASIKYGGARFIQISTDEVYGSIKEGYFDEDARFNPSSPYSASKASAEHLITSARKTFGLRTNIVRCSNNYGTRQFPEKLIPLVISKALKGERIPVYGDGLNSREWLHVEDCAKAIKMVLESGADGASYNISSGVELSNFEVVSKILELLEAKYELIEYVDDRRGHDFRYSISSHKITSELGWKPAIGFTDGLQDTVNWYKQEYSND